MLYINGYFFGTTTPAGVGDPNFSSVTLLLHGDGSLADSSSVAATLTPGAITTSTAQKKFGTASLFSGGSQNGFATTPTSVNYAMGSGAFTIEFWLYLTGTSGSVLGNFTSGNFTTNCFAVWLNGSTSINFQIFNINTTLSTNFTLNAWTHYALVRSGNVWTLYRDGVAQQTVTNSAPLDNGTSSLVTVLGYYQFNFNSAPGYMDDLRITKGVARYTTDFLVPQFPFPDNTGTAVVEYPPAALTGVSTPISGRAYGNGTYVASASSFGSGLEAWKSFNKVVSSVGADWSASAVRYSLTDGAWNSGTTFQTTISSTVYNGEWISLQFPDARIVSSYIIQAINYTSGNYYLTTPYSWVLGGSNDGTTWTLVDSRSSVAYSSYLQQQTFTCSAPASYLYYRLVATYIQPAAPDGLIRIGEWRLFGNPVYEYPPAGLTGPSTPISGQAYGNGTYIASASSALVGTNQEAFRAFNKATPPTNSDWIGGGTFNNGVGPYNLSTGLYPTSSGFFTSISGTDRYGEWLQLQLPAAIVLTSYSIQSANYTEGAYYRRNPYSWYIAGSNDGSTWTQLDIRSSQATTSFQQIIGPFTPSTTPPAYNRFRIVITSINPSSPDGLVQIGDLRLFGY
jgi:hypothetical protein